MSPQFVQLTEDVSAGTVVVGVSDVAVMADEPAGRASVLHPERPIRDKTTHERIARLPPLHCTVQLYEETLKRGDLMRPAGTMNTRFVPEATRTPLRKIVTRTPAGAATVTLIF